MPAPRLRGDMFRGHEETENYAGFPFAYGFSAAYITS